MKPVRGEAVKFPTAPLALVLLPLLLHLPALLGVTSEAPAPIVSGMAAPPGGFAGAPTILGLPGYPGWIDANAGVTVEALGGLAARDWLHGILPWWNPYSGVGLPLAAEAQNAAMFFPFVLLLALPNGLVWLKITMQIITGLATFSLLRRLDLGRRPALSGAVLAQCNGSFAWLAHGPMLPIAFLPLLLLGIEQARARWRVGVVTIAVAVACSLTAGFVEVALLDGLLATVWALVRIARAPRPWVLLGHLFLGAGLGVLLAAPAIEPFLIGLPGAFVSYHGGIFRHVLPAENLALLLFPYLLGPPLYGTLAFGIQIPLWFSAGGYIGILLVMLAMAGLIGRGPEHALRLALGLWIALTVAGACLDSGASIIERIPAVNHINFPVWIVPSWLIAGSILAAFALEDWEQGEQRHVVRAVLAAIVIGLAVLPAAWPEARILLAHENAYWVFALGSLAWGGAVVAAAGLMVALAPRRRFLLHGLVMLDAVLLFALPLAVREPKMVWDRGTLRFLRQTIGLGRVYSMGPMGPNYGALFGIAELNHNYLPVPDQWVQAIRAFLMPRMDGIYFFDGRPDDEARRRLADPTHGLAAYGVRYILTYPGDDPLTARITPPLDYHSQVVQPLGRDGVYEGSFITAAMAPTQATAVSVRVGTYSGAADGALEATICGGGVCASGRAALAGQPDNQPLRIPLDPPLPVAGDTRLSFRLVHRDGSSPVALWLYSGAAGMSADLMIWIASPGLVPTLVRRGSAAYVWALPDAQAYWDAPGCRLTEQTRNEVTAECDRPARLRRLELADPGWAAFVNGQPAAIATVPPVFQAVDLPAGHASVVFSYAPPGIGWAWAAFAIAVGGLAAIGGGRQRQHERQVIRKSRR